MRKYCLYICCVFTCLQLTAQQGAPTDYLNAAFHKGRRDSLRKMMPANSVMAVFAYPERVFSNDVNYVYHPNPDLYYFSGYREPNALLLVFKEPIRYKDSISVNEVLFVQKRDPQQEQWTGKRLGTAGAVKELGFTLALNGNEFSNFPVDFSRFNKIIVDVLPEDGGKGEGSLGELVTNFRSTIGLPPVFDAAVRKDIQMFNQYNNGSNTKQLTNYLLSQLADGTYTDTSLMQRFLQAKDTTERAGITNELTNEKWSTQLYTQYTNTLRGIKTPEELLLLRKAVEISAIAHAEVIKAIRPDLSEREIEGIHDYVQKKYGAEHWGYPAIVGGGNNGCTLHYQENNATGIGNKMLLMDVGAEYHGYSADVTRTVPANGKFSPEQKLIYNIVYDAQEAAFKLCKEGSSLKAPSWAS